MNCVIPADVLQTALLSAAELKREVAVLLFEQERLTLGQAARLAKLPTATFQHLLASREISLHYGIEEFEEDVAVLRERSGPRITSPQRAS